MTQTEHRGVVADGVRRAADGWSTRRWRHPGRVPAAGRRSRSATSVAASTRRRRRSAWRPSCRPAAAAARGWRSSIVRIVPRRELDRDDARRTPRRGRCRRRTTAVRKTSVPPPARRGPRWSSAPARGPASAAGSAAASDDGRAADGEHEHGERRSAATTGGAASLTSSARKRGSSDRSFEQRRGSGTRGWAGGRGARRGRCPSCRWPPGSAPPRRRRGSSCRRRRRRASSPSRSTSRPSARRPARPDGRASAASVGREHDLTGVAWRGSPGRVAGVHERALVDDEQPVAHLLELAEEVGRHEHGAVARRPISPISSRISLMPDRVEAVGRLVEHQQLRVAEQGGGDAEPLLHAERVLAEAVAARAPRPTRSSTAGMRRRSWPPSAGEHPEVLDRR